jgi:hypothetical protein
LDCVCACCGDGVVVSCSCFGSVDHAARLAAATGAAVGVVTAFVVVDDGVVAVVVVGGVSVRNGFGGRDEVCSSPLSLSSMSAHDIFDTRLEDATLIVLE